ncbi:hypothetical protein FJ251_15365 [bacterium]|nr:hypothetical protein [bacterium]
MSPAIWIPLAIGIIPLITQALSKLNLSPRVMSWLPVIQGLVLAFLVNVQGGMTWGEALLALLQGASAGAGATQLRQWVVNWRKAQKVTP